MGFITVTEKPVEEISMEFPGTTKTKSFNKEGGPKMHTTRNKRTKLSFDRPSLYPLPQSLLTGFWGK